MINILKHHHQCLGCWSLISHFQLVEDSSTVVGRKNAFDLVESGKMKIYLEKSPAIDSPGKTGRRGKGRREDSTFEAALLGTEKIHQHLFVLLQQNHRWRKKIARPTIVCNHGLFLFAILQCYLANSIYLTKVKWKHTFCKRVPSITNYFELKIRIWQLFLLLECF